MITLHRQHAEPDGSLLVERIGTFRNWELCRAQLRWRHPSAPDVAALPEEWPPGLASITVHIEGPWSFVIEAGGA